MKLIFGEGPGNVYTLADILPHRFGPFDLLEDKSQPLLLQVQTHSLSFTTGTHCKSKKEVRSVVVATCLLPSNGIRSILL